VGVRKAKRTAQKDAKEYARAKMYYGDGAGTRRKLIKAKVNERSKNSVYKKEFEKALSSQDMAKHASAAKRERVVNTTASTTAKTARGLLNMAVGNVGRASATAISIYTIMHITGLDKKAIEYGKDLLNNLK
jgi:hypothetical protein